MEREKKEWGTTTCKLRRERRDIQETEEKIELGGRKGKEGQDEMVKGDNNSNQGQIQKQMTKQKDVAGGKRRTKLGDNDTEKG